MKIYVLIRINFLLPLLFGEKLNLIFCTRLSKTYGFLKKTFVLVNA